MRDGKLTAASRDDAALDDATSLLKGCVAWVDRPGLDSSTRAWLEEAAAFVKRQIARRGRTKETPTASPEGPPDLPRAQPTHPEGPPDPAPAAVVEVLRDCADALAQVRAFFWDSDPETGHLKESELDAEVESAEKAARAILAKPAAPAAASAGGDEDG